MFFAHSLVQGSIYTLRILSVFTIEKLLFEIYIQCTYYVNFVLLSNNLYLR